jgi:hypothetical protein
MWVVVFIHKVNAHQRLPINSFGNERLVLDRLMANLLSIKSNVSMMLVQSPSSVSKPDWQVVTQYLNMAMDGTAIVGSDHLFMPEIGRAM